MSLVFIKEGIEKGYTVQVTMNSADQSYEVVIWSQHHVEKRVFPATEISPKELEKVLWKK